MIGYNSAQVVEMNYTESHELLAFRERNRFLESENQSLRRTVADLMQSRKDGRCIFYDVPTGMFRASADGTLLCINHTFENMLGVGNKPSGAIVEYLQERPSSIISPGRFIEFVSQGQIEVVVEYGLKRPGSEPLLCSFHAWPVRGDDGTTSYIEGFVEDITEQKMLTDALRESEHKYHALVHHSQLGVAIIKHESVVYANEAIARMGGYTVDEVLALTKDGLSSLIYPEDRNLVWGRHIDRLAGKTVPSRYEFRLVTKNGMIAWVEMIANLIELSGEPAVMITCTDISERKRGERALRLSEKHLAQIIQGTSIATFVIDITHTVTHWNKACELMTGIQAGEMIGTSEQWRAFYDSPRPAMADLVLDRSDNAIFTHYYGKNFRESQLIEGAFEAEDWFPVIGESDKWLFFSAAPLVDENGEVLGAIETIQDITQRKKTEETLKQNRQLLHFAIGQMPIPVIVASASDMMVTIMNTAARDFLSRRLNTIDQFPIGLLHKYLAMCHPDGTALNTGELPLVRAITEGESIYNTEAIVRHKDRIHAWVSVNAAPLFDDDGNIVAGIMTFPDITDRKLNEQALRESEERIRLIIDSSPDGIVIISVDGNFIEINDAFAHIVGYDREELLSINAYAITPSRWHMAQRRFISKILMVHGHGTFEKEYRRKDGVDIPGMMHCWRIPGDGTARARFGAFVRDVSRERAIETQLRQSQKMEAIGTLAAGIAHDFNNALTSILMNTELLMDDPAVDNEMRPLMDDIHTSGIRAKGLVEQILTFSRQTKRERTPTLMKPVVSEALKMLRASIPSTITIEQQYDSSCGPILADPTQIHQIVINLVSNAAHAIGDSCGTITVALNRRILTPGTSGLPEALAGTFNELVVTDTGKGMDTNTIERAFDPFFTTKKIGEGTGMGLAVVHGIVTDYGGAITVKSTPGHGATFHIMLPEYAGPMEPDITDTDDILHGTERVLFVDDESNINKVATHTLGRLGYLVSSFSSSAAALEGFTSDPASFDVVVTDYTMPVLTGVDLAKAIIQIRPGIPIILASGYNDMFNKADIRKLGIHTFLKKPFNGNSLARTLRDTLDSAHSAS